MNQLNQPAGVEPAEGESSEGFSRSPSLPHGSHLIQFSVRESFEPVCMASASWRLAFSIFLGGAEMLGLGSSCGCASTNTHRDTHTHTCTHTNTRHKTHNTTHTYTDIRTDIHRRASIDIHIDTHIDTHIDKRIDIHINMHIRMRMRIHMHIRIHLQTSPAHRRLQPRRIEIGIPHPKFHPPRVEICPPTLHRYTWLKMAIGSRLIW